MCKLTILVLFTLLIILSPASTMAQPEACGFYGNAAIKGQAVDNGTVIKVWIDGIKVASTTTTRLSADGMSYDYEIKITDQYNQYDGKTIIFTVGPNDLQGGSAIWRAGSYDRLDLNGIEQAVISPPVLPNPSISLYPSEGIATRISGKGFTRGASITIMVGDKSAGSATVNNDNDGTFSMVVTAPDQSPGTYTVSAIDTQGRSSQSILIVPDLRGEPGEAGEAGAQGPAGPEGKSGGTTLALVAIILSAIAIVLAILVAIRVSSFIQRR